MSKSYSRDLIRIPWRLALCGFRAQTTLKSIPSTLRTGPPSKQSFPRAQGIRGRRMNSCAWGSKQKRVTVYGRAQAFPVSTSSGPRLVLPVEHNVVPADWADMSEEIDRAVGFRIDLASHSLDLSNLPIDNGRKDSKQAARRRHLTAKVSPITSSELPIKDAPCQSMQLLGLQELTPLLSCWSGGRGRMRRLMLANRDGVSTLDGTDCNQWG